MILKLARKLGSLKEINSLDPNINELAALLTGQKKVIFLNYSQKNGDIFRFCDELKLKYLSPFELNRTVLDRSRKPLLIGFDEKALKLARAASRDPVSFEWGMSLGYPECCVKSYIAWKKTSAKDIVSYIYGNTVDRSRLPFELNNVYNYFSRGITYGPKMNAKARADSRDFEKINATNRELELSSLQVISWHPCSYNCAESARKGQVIYKFLTHYVPEFAARRKELLSKPVVFLDKFKFLTLDAPVIKKSGGSVDIAFGRVSYPHSVLKYDRDLAGIKMQGSKIVSAGIKEKVKEALLLDFR